ncbi:MAG: hypothetical protein U0903_14440 [Planctomycetales bacterium]
MLMTFLLYLGIVVQLAWRPGWTRTLCISLIMAGCALTKGPTGPLLYLLFLAWWCWENQTWERTEAWKHFCAGSALCLGIVGVWVAAVWQMPDFQEQVIYWQLGDRLVDPERARSFMLPIVYLFTRIAPWPVLALAGVWMSRRQQIAWPEVQGLVIWTLLFLAFFCAIPTKRHDHVLPVYPPVYLLAGFALKQILEPVLLPRARWVMWPLCGFLMLSPFVLPWVNEPQVWGLMAGAFVCGAVGFLIYLHGRRFAFVVAAAGLLCLHGLYHHQIHGEGRVDYDKLLAFVKEVKTKRSPTERLAVFHAHPLIAYELRMHETLIKPQDVAVLQPTWVITTEEQMPKLQEAMQAELILVEKISLAPRRDRADVSRRPDAGRKTMGAERTAGGASPISVSRWRVASGSIAIARSAPQLTLLGTTVLSDSVEHRKPPGDLTRAVVEKDAGSDGNIERVCAVLHGDGDFHIRRGDDLRREAIPFIAEHQSELAGTAIVVQWNG